MGLITFLVSYYVTKDTRANAETTNFTLNSRTASDAENRINSVVSNVSLFCDLFDDPSKSHEEIVLDKVKKVAEDGTVSYFVEGKTDGKSAFCVRIDY